MHFFGIKSLAISLANLTTGSHTAVKSKPVSTTSKDDTVYISSAKAPEPKTGARSSSSRGSTQQPPLPSNKPITRQEVAAKIAELKAEQANIAEQ
jgi:hypothetical protein